MVLQHLSMIFWRFISTVKLSFLCLLRNPAKHGMQCFILCNSFDLKFTHCLENVLPSSCGLSGSKKRKRREQQGRLWDVWCPQTSNWVVILVWNYYEIYRNESCVWSRNRISPVTLWQVSIYGGKKNIALPLDWPMQHPIMTVNYACLELDSWFWSLMQETESPKALICKLEPTCNDAEDCTRKGGGSNIRMTWLFKYTFIFFD